MPAGGGIVWPPQAPRSLCPPGIVFILAGMSAVRLISAVCLFALLGCQSPVPTGREVRELHWPASSAITPEAAEANSRIRLALWQTFTAGTGRAVAKLPARTMDQAPLPLYLEIDHGTARLLVDYRRNRHADKPPVEQQMIIGLRPGYYDRGRFIDATDMPPSGRELILLLQTEAGEEVRF